MTFKEAQHKAYDMAREINGACVVILFENGGRLVQPLQTFKRYADEKIEYMMFPYSDPPLPAVA